MQGYRETIEKILLACVAGLLGYLMRTYRLGQKVRLINCVIETASSGFVGYLAYLLMIAAKMDPNWIGPIVGVMGWMGANASIRLLETLVRRKLGVTEVTTVETTETTETTEKTGP
jgi:hypothetical protein